MPPNRRLSATSAATGSAGQLENSLRAGDLERVTGEFEAFARARGCGVVYVCAYERMAPGRASVVAGEQPVWDPHGWEAILKSRPSLRAQLHRAANKGVRIEAMDPHQAAASAEITSVLNSWLASRPLPPLHFMTEPDVLRGCSRRSPRFRCTAQRTDRRRPCRLAHRRPQWVTSSEEIARIPHAPNGTSELLIDGAMRAFALIDTGHTSPCKPCVAPARDSFRDNPRWLRILMYMARAHANRFYNFRGLEAFRSKMRPDSWERVCFISNEPRFSVRALYAIGAAFAGISPVRAIAIAILKGAAQEIRALVIRILAKRRRKS